jgi:hypothetical protein
MPWSPAHSFSSALAFVWEQQNEAPGFDFYPFCGHGINWSACPSLSPQRVSPKGWTAYLLKLHVTCNITACKIQKFENPPHIKKVITSFPFLKVLL